MKPIAWYDPTNGMVSADKDSPLFTPLGQVLPLYTKQEDGGWTPEQATQIERERCAKIVERAIVRNRYNLMHVEMLKRVHAKIVKPKLTGQHGGLSQEQLELPFGN